MTQAIFLQMHNRLLRSPFCDRPLALPPQVFTPSAAHRSQAVGHGHLSELPSVTTSSHSSQITHEWPSEGTAASCCGGIGLAPASLPASRAGSPRMACFCTHQFCLLPGLIPTAMKATSHPYIVVPPSLPWALW